MSKPIRMSTPFCFIEGARSFASTATFSVASLFKLFCLTDHPLPFRGRHKITQPQTNKGLTNQLALKPLVRSERLRSRKVTFPSIYRVLYLCIEGATVVEKDPKYLCSPTGYLATQVGMNPLDV